MKKLFTCRKIKSRRKSLVKERKKRKTGPKKKVRESFCEAISIGRAPRWRPDLDKEVASNYNFESCLSIRFLAPQHLLQFFHFCRGFYLCLFATLPIIVPPSSTLQWAIEIKKCLPWVTYPGKSLSFVIDARINGVYSYRLTGVIVIPRWIGCCEKARKFLVHESFVATKCRVCSQFNEITKEERGTKIIQHLSSTYNSALSLLHHTPNGNVFIKKWLWNIL